MDKLIIQAILGLFLLIAAACITAAAIWLFAQHWEWSPFGFGILGGLIAGVTFLWGAILRAMELA